MAVCCYARRRQLSWREVVLEMLATCLRHQFNVLQQEAATFASQVGKARAMCVRAR